VLPARHRLRKSADFATVFRGARGAGGSRSGSQLIVVHASSTTTRAGQPPRIGLVVSKAVGNAVARNRSKRILRALMSARTDRLPDGVDLVIRVKPDLPAASTARIADDLDRLLSKVLRRFTPPEGR
jgi:ribonuclease P protein component